MYYYVVNILKGRIKGIFDKDFDLHFYNKKELSLEELKYLYGDFVIQIRDELGNFYYMNSPSGVYDLFYTKINNKYKFFTNFFEIFKEKKYLSYDPKAIQTFKKKGYVPNNETLFKEIKKVKLGYLYLANNDFIKEINIYKRDSDIEKKINYLNFKKILNQTVEFENTNKNNFLLLSSGVDSNLLLAILSKKVSNLELVTMYYKNPTLGMNEKDNKIVKKVKDFYKLKLHNVDIDFNDYDIEKLKKQVLNMPLSTHISYGFEKMFTEILKMNKMNPKIWAGQDADTFYNLGPTAKNLAELLNRYLLSDNYISSLKDVDGNYKYLKRLIGYTINKIVSFKKREKYFLPKYLEDYKESFFQGPGYFPLNNNKNKNIKNANKMQKKSLKKAREEIFDLKLNSFFRGGDHKVIVSNSQNKIFLPYSSNIMIYFFKHMDYTIKDVFRPKRYIYRYLIELLGKQNYKNIFEMKFDQKNNFSNFEKNLIDKTIFGKQLYDFTKIDSYNVQAHLSYFWLKYLDNHIKENYNVQIINDFEEFL